LGDTVTVPLEIETVAVFIALVPPVPMQVSEYDVVAVRAPVLCVPLVAFAPLQPPEAVQEVALVELHVSVEALPLGTEAGFAVSATVGADATVMVALATLLVPPVPLQVSEYDVVTVIAPVSCVPLVAFAPLQPPEAVQEVALVELHVNVDAAPLTTEVCAALRDAVGDCTPLFPEFTSDPHAATSSDATTIKLRIRHC